MAPNSSHCVLTACDEKAWLCDAFFTQYATGDIALLCFGFKVNIEVLSQLNWEKSFSTFNKKKKIEEITSIHTSFVFIIIIV